MGGGICANGGGLIKDCLIAFNSATNMAGGIYLNNGGTVRDSIIRSNYADYTGGGVYCDSGGTVSNCLIADNIAMVYAAGVYVVLAGFSIQNCIISNNYVITNTGYGGGVYFRPRSWTNYLQDCVIVGNRATNGSGIYCYEWGGIVQNCRVINNYGQTGAGVMGDLGTIFRNCLIAGNRANGYAGGVYCQMGTNMFENCTIVSNVCGAYGGGIFVRSGALGTNVFVNSIIYFNQSVYGDQSSNLYTYGGVSVGVFSNSCMAPTNRSGTALGSGNFADNPQLVDYQALNCRLTANSPCINRGLYLPWMDGALDLDGHSRIDRFRRNVDVGAYEYIRRGSMIMLY